MAEQDQVFLDRAVKLARQSVASGGGPFGAVIVQDSVIVAEGCNLVTKSWDPTAHAEIVAIRAACEKMREHRLVNCTIYASTEPCPMCLSAIYWSRAERIVFSATRHDAAAADFDDELLYRELALPLAQRALPTEHIAHPDALKPFLDWKAHESRLTY